MSRYSGLDKIDVKGLELVESYAGAKIYNCTDDNHDAVSSGFLAVKRGYMIDCGLTTKEYCKEIIDHFNSD